MTGNGGFLVALATATGVHVAALGWLPPVEGAESAGGSGNEPLSIALAGASVAALVETWETAPTPAQALPTMEAPQLVVPDATSIAGETPVRTASVQALAPMKTATAPSVLTTEARLVAPASDPAPWLPDTTSAPQTPKIAALTSPARASRPAMDTSAPAVPDFAVTASLRPAPRTLPEVRSRATGQGQSATAGAGSADAPRQSTASQQAQASAQAAWAAAIQRKVAQAQVYPRGGRGDGRVRLAMTITASGSLAGVRVVQSSGVSAFDKAAVRAAKRAAPFPKAPDVLTDARFAFGQWVTFRR